MIQRMLIVAGGTGGHIFPALAVARQCRLQHVIVHWLGTRAGLEQQVVAAEFPLSYVNIRGWRGKGVWRKLFAPVSLCRAIWQAIRVIRTIRPDIVLAFGGYVSGPGGIAAWLTRTPFIVHEQNAIPGMTNRWLSKIANHVLQAFPHTFPKHFRVTTTGNPVRAELTTLPMPTVRLRGRENQPLRILVLGGSQGAHAINEAMIAALYAYPDRAALHIWHQTGARDLDAIQKRYAAIPVVARVNDFIQAMQEAYTWADMLICRAGALTVSEVAAVGIASIFVPYPQAVDNHQWHNSRYLVAAGAARVIAQDQLNKDALILLFQEFTQHRERLVEMAEKARALAKPHAVDSVIAQCEKLYSK